MYLKIGGFKIEMTWILSILSVFWNVEYGPDNLYQLSDKMSID